jgi:hypothetical protein
VIERAKSAGYGIDPNVDESFYKKNDQIKQSRYSDLSIRVPAFSLCVCDW